MTTQVVRAVHTIVDRPYPDDGVAFELTLNFDSPEADPMQMLLSDGYREPEKWQFTGKKWSGIQTRRFKLVRVGACRNLDEVKERIAQYGEIPEGQWREAFKAAYPESDFNGPIGFADSSWIFPNGDFGFPVIYSFGGSDFYRAYRGPSGDWRWLVPVSK